MGNYLIPANTKKSLLILGVFNRFDLFLFGIGIGATVALLLILNVQDVTQSILALLPGLTTGFLILPIPNYHNMLTVIKNCIHFFTNNQRYIWRGWCMNGKEESKRN